MKENAKGWSDRDRFAPIGVFDSGMGGLSVLAALLRRLRGERFVYLSDPAHAPYGSRSEGEIRDLTEAGVRRLLDLGCKAVVLGCNTATNAAAEAVRTWYPTLLGVEPAVKPAVAATWGKVLVLTTPATACRRKFRTLCARYGEGRLIVAPQPGLAARIEADIFRPAALEEAVREALAPHPEAEAAVLGCTHYALIRPLFEKFLPAFDGNEGVARRAEALLREYGLTRPAGESEVEFADASGALADRYRAVLCSLFPEGPAFRCGGGESEGGEEARRAKGPDVPKKGKI